MSPSDEAIDAIYEASTRPASWNGALLRVGTLFRTATGALYVENHRGIPTLRNVGVMFGHSDCAVAEYGDYYCTRNPFNRASRWPTMGEVVTDTSWFRMPGNAERFEESEYYQDWVQPQRLRHIIAQRVRSIGSDVLCAAFWRPRDAGPYSADEMSAFGVILRHTNRALDIGTRLRAAECEMAAILDRAVSAVFTLDRDGRVRQTNAAADALLRSADGLSLVGGRLRASAPQDQAMLDRLLTCAADAQFRAWAENARVEFRRPSGRPPLVARAIAVAQRFDPFALDRSACVVLTVEGHEAEGSAIEARLRRRFGLSPAQARVAAALRSGKALADAAAALGICHETARTHLKAIFERTCTRRQADLVMLLQRETAL